MAKIELVLLLQCRTYCATMLQSSHMIVELLLLLANRAV